MSKDIDKTYKNGLFYRIFTIGGQSFLKFKDEFASYDKSDFQPAYDDDTTERIAPKDLILETYIEEINGKTIISDNFKLKKA